MLKYGLPTTSKRFFSGNSLTTEKEKVVVTGIGMISPLGVGARISWDNLCGGKSAATEIIDERFSKIPSKVACFIPKGEQMGQFDINKVFTKAEQQRMSRSMMYGLVAAKEALEDAKWKPESLSQKVR